MNFNLAWLLQRAGKIWPEQPAICHGHQLHSDYRECARRATSIASALLTRYGLQAGDRVAIVMHNQPEYIEALFGIWHAGLVAVPVNAKLHPRELAFIIEDCGARVCLVSAGFEEQLSTDCVVAEGEAWSGLLREAPRDMAVVAADDIAWLFYTSGTTGQPKGAMLSHGNLQQMILSFFADVASLRAGGHILHPAPLSHGSGLYSLAAVQGGACQVVPDSGGFDAEEIFGLIERYPGAFFFAAPTMVKRLVESPAAATADTTNLDGIVYGGGPMYLADLKAALALFGNKLGQIYGQGESPMTITCLSPTMHAGASDDRLTSVGVSHSVVDVAVVNEQGESLPPSEIGEICVRGEVVMRGYWNQPEATAATLRDGWLHTGDMGVFDADGFLTLKDRVKDVIISGGSNIYPREVEEILLTHPAVVEVSVVGQPDPEWGEVVVACVVTRDGADVTEMDLDELCLANIARFKRPKHYVFLDALPKNNYGKILKTSLRATLEQRL